MKDDVIYYIERSNQRSDRMFSIIDLLKAKTLTLNQAAWLTNKVQNGSSFLVGAKPGSAGKTTVVGALLTMLPKNAKIHLTDGSGWKTAKTGEYLLSYEIGRGHYDGYISGNDLKDMLSLAKTGCKIVANLHADTLTEAKTQIINDSGADETYFNLFNIFIPIKTGKNIEEIHYFTGEKWEIVESNIKLKEDELKIAVFLKDLQEKNIFTIQNVRKEFLNKISAFI